MQERSRISVVAAAMLCASLLAMGACGQRGPLVAPGAKPGKAVAHQQASAARAAAASAALPASPAASRAQP